MGENRDKVAGAALRGWRGRVAEGVAGPISERSGLSPEQARSLLALIFFAASAYYVASTVFRALKESQ